MKTSGVRRRKQWSLNKHRHLEMSQRSKKKSKCLLKNRLRWWKRQKRKKPEKKRS